MISDMELGWVARQNDLDRFAAALAREEDPEDELCQARAEAITGIYIENMSSSEKEYVGREIARKRGF